MSQSNRITTLRELFSELVEACTAAKVAIDSCSDMQEGGLTDAGDTWFGMAFSPTLVEEARERLDDVLVKVDSGWLNLLEDTGAQQTGKAE